MALPQSALSELLEACRTGDGVDMIRESVRTVLQELVEFEAAGVAFRGSFLIDKNGVVRHQVVNDLPLGRNVDEMLRMVDALQFTEQHGEVCPAGWNKGEAGMKPTADGVAVYLAANAEKL